MQPILLKFRAALVLAATLASTLAHATVVTGTGNPDVPSFRRIENQTVEIVRNCGAGAWTKLVWRTGQRTNSFWRFPNSTRVAAVSTATLVFEKQ